MTVTTSTPRVYLASLTDYNAGTLHGCWVDAVDEAEMWLAVTAMLANSPEATRDNPAEEWAIHDYEGFHGDRLHEYTSLDRVALIGAAIDATDDPEALMAWLNEDTNEVDIEERVAEFTDHYQGRFSSMREWAQEWADTYQLVPEDADWPWYCIDWDHAADALQLGLSANNGWSFIEVDGDTLVFSY
jgi:antirestriction protein